jgi:HK97 gp10 family phage protein
MRLSGTATFTPRVSAGSFVQSVIAPAVENGLQQIGALFVEVAQGYCPVATGALRDSIAFAIVTGAGSAVVIIGAGMYYASYVEYGTGRRGGPAPYAHVMSWPGQHPQPYMRPALDETQGQYVGIIAGALNDALEGA